ncbi:MAG: TIGR04084 family radical SAM/SPASM domain-containing protein [Gammaproteobacteria bacterium]|nr:TIGR04084 family radical SAM/SPASM domain-containing protein [Gammaproteobacteria bacterium]
MDYVIFTTDVCNLRCKYCFDPDEQWRQRKNGTFYDFQTLKTFVERDKGEIRLMLYGGEPLVNIDFVTRCINEIRHHGVFLQTNGQLLHRIPDDLLPKIDIIGISLDGPPEITNAIRGPGVYEKAIRNASALRQRGFPGVLHARMTIEPVQNDICRSVGHFFEDCEVAFDSVYWQLNAQFWPEQWALEGKSITKWFRESYNPGVTVLAEKFVTGLLTGRPVLNCVPFAAIALLELRGERLDYMQCRAGRDFMGISTNGDIYTCPVAQCYPHHKLGHITQTDFDYSRFRRPLNQPCPDCDVLHLCGGRCLLANTEKEWGEDGHALVCESVKHLVAETRRCLPRLKAAVEAGKVHLEDLAKAVNYSECTP